MVTSLHHDWASDTLRQVFTCTSALDAQVNSFARSDPAFGLEIDTDAERGERLRTRFGHEISAHYIISGAIFDARHQNKKLMQPFTNQLDRLQNRMTTESLELPPT